ncbi:unnamed protein product [Aspergillus oryzae]|uniref:Unnamed protein product n=2 Tax=Aspergillus oryzae TaxID=5062 RepID=A0AAN4YM30_ASPOZ|nr:unnamed protein product [Aspergillus oryzae]GMF96801.1 unnamed protein product [Aspergillus oryzae]GMG30468.1 unnamed protein product [Aspergillus oryzae]GMG52810.1 unnamed protein product [Aspergillus oryzae var. brunneus]
MASHSDFSRFARRPGAQVKGQLFSFLISGNVVPILGIFGTAAAAKMYGDVNELGLWNPPNILQMWLDNQYHNKAMRAAAFFVAFGLTSSIMAMNSIENGVSGGMDIAGLYPRYFNIRRGSYLLAAISVVINPWQIIANGAIFTNTLNSFGGELPTAIQHFSQSHTNCSSHPLPPHGHHGRRLLRRPQAKAQAIRPLPRRRK